MHSGMQDMVVQGASVRRVCSRPASRRGWCGGAVYWVGDGEEGRTDGRLEGWKGFWKDGRREDGRWWVGMDACCREVV